MATEKPLTQKQVEVVGTGRVAELDGFRAMAIWMVLFAHLIDGWPLAENATNGLPHFLVAAMQRGWLGVDLFFVLSGFLITGILLDSKDKPHYFRNFYGRRALRILPLYLVVIGLEAIAYRGNGNFFLLCLFFGANFAALLRVGIPHGPGVAWSLAVEEQFYLGWPLVVRLASRRTLATICISIFLAEPVLRGVARLHGLDPELQIAPLPWFHFDGLALGALLSIWIRSPKCTKATSLRLAGTMLALSVLILAIGWPFGVAVSRSVASTALRLTHMNLLFASAILAALALAGTTSTAFLRHPFLRITSEFSYCIYLVHLAIGDGYRSALHAVGVDPVALLGGDWAWRCQSVVILTISFGVAAVSKKYLEDPFLSLKQRYF